MASHGHLPSPSGKGGSEMREGILGVYLGAWECGGWGCRGLHVVSVPSSWDYLLNWDKLSWQTGFLSKTFPFCGSLTMPWARPVTSQKFCFCFFVFKYNQDTLSNMNSGILKSFEGLYYLYIYVSIYLTILIYMYIKPININLPFQWF